MTRVKGIGYLSYRLIGLLCTGSLFLFPSCLYGAQTVSTAVATPDGVATNTLTIVTIIAKVGPDPTLIPGSVNLIAYDAQGRALSTLGLLYDDGTHGDQQAGDNVFTNQLQVTQPTPTQLFFKVSAAFKGKLTRVLSPLITVDVVDPIPSSELQAIHSTNQQARDLLASLAATQGLASARTAVVTWLSGQPNVKTAGIAADGESIWVQFTDGVYGAVMSNPSNTWGTPSNSSGLVASPVDDIAEPELVSVYNKWLTSQFIHPVPILRDQEVTIDGFKNLYKYGVISLATHGMISNAGDPIMLASTEPDSIPIAIDVRRGLIIPGGFNAWFITPAFIKHYNGTFPGTIVFLSVCHSLDNTNLSQAFIQNGAQAVFGWKNSVTVTFAKTTKDALMVQMLDNGRTAGYAFQSVVQIDTDPGHDNPNALLMLDGNHQATLVPGPTFTMSSGSQSATNGQTLNLVLPSGAIQASVIFTTASGGDLSLDGAPLFSLAPQGSISVLIGLGTHIVSLALGSVQVSGTIVISYPQPPTAGFTMSLGQQIATEGQTLNVTVPSGGSANVVLNGTSRSSAANGGAITGWAWTIDGALAGNAGQFSHFFSVGMHTVGLIVTDNRGAQSQLVQGTIVVSQGSSGPSWTQKFPSTVPTGSTFTTGWVYYAMAYDSVRNQAIFFNILGETWTWDGSNWTQKFPAASPPARQAASMAFDSQRSQAVLFGGLVPGANTSLDVYLNDTWTWDGSNWTQKFPSTNPLGRYRHALAYDQAHQQVILFGGYSWPPQGAGGLPYLNDTWTWDGSNWTQKFPAASPPARMAHAMAYDSQHGQAVLFGGTNGAPSFLNDTWLWDGVTWTQQQTNSTPSGRGLFGMAFDAAQNYVLLFGGLASFSACSPPGGPPGECNDTWTWDGFKWTQQQPSNIPSARYGHQLVYDSARQQIMMFDGVFGSSAGTGDTWVWGP